MSVSRRRFIATAGATLGGCLTPEALQAAAAGSSRVYFSELTPLEIAWGLVVGLGKQVWLAVRGLDQGQIETYIKNLNERGFEAGVQTLRERVPLRFESLELTVNGQPQPETVKAHEQELRRIASEDADSEISPQEARELLAELQKAKSELLTALENGNSVGLDYDVYFRETAHFRISNLIERERVQVKLTLRSPVRIFNGAEFVANLRKYDKGAQVTTSLWADVCVGRREGPLVRRIAHNQITCREAQFLAELECQVKLLFWHPEQSKVHQMLPELIRRIAEGP